MTTIIAGGFELHDDAQAAMARLREAGVADANIFTFRVNPPGEHDQDPVGGDSRESPGTEKADRGALKGATVGAVVGAAAGALATPLVGPIVGVAGGAGVGAYTGALVGALRGIDKDKGTHRDDIRPAETMVAVNVGDGGVAASTVIRILEECRAQQVEETQGRWEDGEWTDFDPLSRPRLVHAVRGVSGTDSRSAPL